MVDQGRLLEGPSAILHDRSGARPIIARAVASHLNPAHGFRGTFLMAMSRREPGASVERDTLESTGAPPPLDFRLLVGHLGTIGIHV